MIIAVTVNAKMAVFVFILFFLWLAVSCVERYYLLVTSAWFIRTHTKKLYTPPGMKNYEKTSNNLHLNHNNNFAQPIQCRYYSAL